MQRILHITGTMDRAGAETMIMNLYRVIDRRKFQFDFVTFSNKIGDYEEEIESLGGKIYRVNERNVIKRTILLKKLLEEHPEYKIIHGHTLLSNGFHVWAAMKAGVPKRIVHAHSTNDISNKSLVGRLYKRIALKLIDKYATHYIGCGLAPARYLFPKQNNVLILPNSIDTVYFAKVGLNNKNYINDELKIDNSCLKLIQIGRLQTVKNHLFSLRIAEKLKEKGVSFKMLFVGQGELKDSLLKEIKDRKLTNEVVLTGLRTDIPQLLVGSDVMLMPSLHEGFPVVLVEAQSAGIPSLISDTVSPEVDLGVNLVEFESLESPIANWIEKIMELKIKDKMDQSLRLDRIMKKGFDIHSSVGTLTNLYK